MREREKVEEETTGKKEGKDAGALSLTRKKMEAETSGEKEASVYCEKKQELLFSRERARANRSSGETLRTACCIFRAAQRRAVAFQPTRARRFRSGTIRQHNGAAPLHVPLQPLGERA